MQHIIKIGLVALALIGGLLGAATTPATAQQPLFDINVWNVHFYNNQYLIGPAVASRQDRNIAFNWGTGSPMPGVNADNFSARWSASGYVEGGTYRFAVVADDGVQLWVNGRKVIDAYNNPRVGETLYADVQLESGHQTFQLDYREITGEAYVYLNWGRVGTVTAPTAPTAPLTPAGQWRAEYFNNPDLQGAPIVITYEASPNHNWGIGAPPGINPDLFSARWSTTKELQGRYQLSVTADDGVRVWVNGVLKINEWHDWTGQTYTATFEVSRGWYPIVIEYYERTGNAFISYNLTQLSSDYTPPQPAGPSLVVNTRTLNVRNAPGLHGSILTKISQGQTFPVTGRNADTSWYQIQFNGQSGWVSAAYVIPQNTGNVPVVGTPQSPQQPSGHILTSVANLNIRSGPGVNFSRLSVLPRGQAAAIIGRNASSTWWQINYNGLIGWVSGAYVQLPPNFNANVVPIH